MKTVFVDTSGFYAFLDGTDPFHPQAKSAFLRAQDEKWVLCTTNYLVHETWAIVQHRLGWNALDDLLTILIPLCQIEFVDPTRHAAGVKRCQEARQRRLSLTDCVSFETMEKLNIAEAIAEDIHFERQGITLP